MHARDIIAINAAIQSLQTVVFKPIDREIQTTSTISITWQSTWNGYWIPLEYGQQCSRGSADFYKSTNYIRSLRFFKTENLRMVGLLKYWALTMNTDWKQVSWGKCFHDTVEKWYILLYQDTWYPVVKKKRQNLKILQQN